MHELSVKSTAYTHNEKNKLNIGLPQLRCHFHKPKATIHYIIYVRYLLNVVSLAFKTHSLRREDKEGSIVILYLLFQLMDFMFLKVMMYRLYL